MEFLSSVFVEPFTLMIDIPDLLLQTIWEGFVSGILYALIALGFVLIFKASGVFNFAQGIMVVFAALALVSLHTKLGLPAWLALLVAIAVMGALAWGIGSSEAEHAMATNTLRVQKPKTMRVTFKGKLPFGATSKDMILHLTGVAPLGDQRLLFEPRRLEGRFEIVNGSRRHAAL